MDNLNVAMMTAVMAAVTAMLRILPFIVFGRGKETPEVVTYLGKVLPYSIMAMLVVYCLKGISVLEAPYGIPELLSCAAVVLLHLWKRNTLMSIACGTVCYMVLIQIVF